MAKVHLPKGQRLIINWLLELGTFKAVAADLNMSAKAVEVQARRAAQRIQKRRRHLEK